jgi:2-amino-4-hydroxy-6-hydroxymethyldihydropteridine diphosphokinase
VAAAVVVDRRKADVATGQVWTPAYVGLGSNLDDPARQLDAAVAALGTLPDTRLIAVSRRYRTRPVGVLDQPDFLNAAAAVITRRTAAEFLADLQALERQLGKVPPAVRFGPRRIDLDVLVFGAERSEAAELTLPHPRLHERAFVLYPLADIAPALWIAGRGRVATLKARLAGEPPLPL